MAGQLYMVCDKQGAMLIDNLGESNAQHEARQLARSRGEEVVLCAYYRTHTGAPVIESQQVIR